VEHVAGIGENRNTHKILVKNSNEMRLLGRRRWEDNIKMDFKAIGWESADWIYFAQNRDQWLALMNLIMDFWVP
jgi:hypothetical protein